MMVTKTIRGRAYSVSEKAAEVLSALSELETAGLIFAMSLTGFTDGEISERVEVDAPEVLTWEGRQFLKAIEEGTDDI